MSETTNVTKQFLDKIGLDALWNKICSIFASKQELEDVRNEIPTIVQSDWNESDTSSDAFIKNKTHGETITNIRTIGSYTHTNDITYIKHNNATFNLELGVRTQINSGPPAWVTLTSSNTILIEETSSGWISAYPVSIIDVKKIDEKYLPDNVLNVNIPQPDWNESDTSSHAFIKNKTHGETKIAITSAGEYIHTSEINTIEHNGNTYVLEEGVRTQININNGPPAWVTLTSSNTILIEETASGWISAHPVYIIDVQKIDVKYLPDDILNVNAPQSDWNEMGSYSPSYIKGRTHWMEYYYNEINSTGQYNLDDYAAIYPVIINFNDNMYEVHEGENRLSWGPPLLVNLSGNILTIDESSYVNEDYKIRVATHVQKLNNIYLNTITLDMLDDVWEDVIGHDDAILDEGTLNTRKLG